MDKFGIFKLLSGFLDIYKQSCSKNEQTKKSSDTKENLLSSLLKPHEPEQKPSQTQPIPLQNNMLTTMRTHDEFVKRVKSTAINHTENLPK